MRLLSDFHTIVVTFRVLEGFERTNNNIEGWHNAMKTELMAPGHGNIYRFIQRLRKESRTRDTVVQQLMDRAPTPHISSPAQRARNTRILNLVLDFENPQRTRLQYLQAIGRNFNL